jgi:hypothetical protein
MAWDFDGQFTATKRNEDGTITVKHFTSHAQARQFIENENDIILAVRITKPVHPKDVQPVCVPRRLTPEQKALKEAAMKQLKGL